MREFTLEFVRESAPGRTDRLDDARSLLARLTASWRSTAREPLPDRYESLYRVADSEIAAAIAAAAVARAHAPYWAWTAVRLREPPAAVPRVSSSQRAAPAWTGRPAIRRTSPLPVS